MHVLSSLHLHGQYSPGSAPFIGELPSNSVRQISWQCHLQNSLWSCNLPQEGWMILAAFTTWLILLAHVPLQSSRAAYQKAEKNSPASSLCQ